MPQSTLWESAANSVGRSIDRYPAPPCGATRATGRDAHRVARDDLLVELHPPAPAHDDLSLELVGRRADLKVRRAVKPGPDVLQVLPEVAQRKRHAAKRYDV